VCYLGVEVCWDGGEAVEDEDCGFGMGIGWGGSGWDLDVVVS